MGSHAPLYTTRERVLILFKALAVVLPLFLFAWLWLLPWLQDYLPDAHCHRYGSLTGMHLLLYGAFVGLPLSLALLILLFEGRRGLRVLRVGQYPLPGEKVLRKTRYRYGTAARIRPLLLLLCVCFMLAMSAWGYLQATALIGQIAPCAAAATSA